MCCRVESVPAPIGWLLWAIVSLGLPGSVEAQGKRADYERAANLRELTANKVFRDRVEPNWSEDGSRLWYRVRTAPDQHEFVVVDVEKGSRVPAFDHERLAAALQAVGIGSPHSVCSWIGSNGPQAIPPKNLSRSVRSTNVWNSAAAARRWACNLESYELRELPALAAETGTSRPLQSLARGPKSSRRTGSETELTFVNRTGGPVELFWLDPDGKRRSYGRLQVDEERAQHTFAGHVWLLVDDAGEPLGVCVTHERPMSVDVSRVLDSSDEKGTAESEEGGDDDRQGEANVGRSRNTSPDGQWSAFVRDDNVWLRNAASGEEFILSSDGTSEDAYGDRFYWSPDSTMLVAVRTKAGEERTVYYIESSPDDQLQPKLHSHTYAKPGDRIPIDRPRLFRVASRTQVPVSDELFPNPWSITEIRWAPDSSRFTFVYNQRGHQCLRLLSVTASDGAVSCVIDEHNSTFINYSGNYYLKRLETTQEVIWMSERDGWNHLYLYDGCSGSLKNQITRGAWVVRGVEQVDEANRQIWFRAGGIRPGQDPYYVHFCRIGFDGTGLVILTEGDGDHSVEFSPDRRYPPGQILACRYAACHGNEAGR